MAEVYIIILKTEEELTPFLFTNIQCVLLSVPPLIMCASLIFFVEYKTYNKSKATSASARKK